MELDRRRIETVVQAVADRLDGDWLLVGGALVALWFEPGRTTEDVDLVGIGGGAERRLELLGLASDLGLPVEALNSAADFFVERVPGWRDEVEVLRRGKRGTVYRPTPTLFLILKAGRLSDRDLLDCEGLLDKAAAESLPVDVSRVRAALDAQTPAEDEDLARRRARLRRRLATA